MKTQARSPVKIRPSNPLQRRPEFADILHVFESQHFVDQGRATCRSQDRRDEVVRFRNNLLARQGILRRAPHVSDPLAQLCAVAERHLDDGLAPGAASIDPRVGDNLYLGPLLQHGWIFHPRLVMRGSERDRLIQQHHRDHVLHADVRHVAIAYRVGFVTRDPHHHFLRVVSCE